MPLRKFGDQDFDKFIRDKFELAPQPAFDSKAWDSFVSKKGGTSLSKYWTIRIAYVLIGLVAIITLTQLAGHQRWTVGDSETTLSENNQLFETPGEKALLQGVEETDKSSHLAEQEPLGKSDVVVNELSSGSEEDSSTKVTDEKENSPAKVVSALTEPAIFEGGNGNKELVETSNKFPLVNNDNSSSDQSQSSSNYSGEVGNKEISERVKDFQTLENDSEDFRDLSSKALSFDFDIPTIGIPGTRLNESANVSSAGLPKEEEVVIEKGSKLQNRLVVSALLNADLSTVRFDDFTSPGVGLGIRLSYRLSDKFTIGGGITKTRRIYNVTDRQDYSLPQWLLDRQGFPTGVAAECNITEIPISLRYDLFSSPNSNLYGQISSSTFLMDREFYDFEFAVEPTGPNAVRDWTVERQNKHFFGVVGLTVGYEKYFTRRIGVGLEFYWQTTIQGIGIYQVDLNSVGNQILLNYRLF